jgi:cytoskeletal protein RodZ
MESVGERIRSAREAKGLSVEELSKRTRVGRAFLEAMEEDRYEVFPARTYVVGFLRSCARALDLDEAELLRLYRADRGEEAEEEDHLWGDEPEEPEARRPNRALPYLVVLAVLLATAAYLYLTRVRR